jgi:hypothetical protein
MPEQWPRALLRAALRDAGYDALGAPGLSAALRYRPDVADRGPVRLVVLDQETLSDAAEPEQLAQLLRRHGDPAIVLLARATRATPPGNWRRVIQRPASIAEIVAAVEQLLPLPPASVHPLD